MTPTLLRSGLSRTLVLLSLLPLAGCSAAYYGALERFGVEKRDILRSRIRDGRDAQAEAKQQFRSALEAFQEETGYEGGDLEDFYERLRGELERCEARAAEVRDEIRSIDEVAEDLFAEWESEAQQYTSRDLRRKAERMLRDTRGRYKELISAMRRAEKSMDPVLAGFRDQVMFLKHNLNARAIASLQDNAAAIESDVAVLTREMERAISEADAFIASLE
jgi:gas vesicle protein